MVTPRPPRCALDVTIFLPASFVGDSSAAGAGVLIVEATKQLYRPVASPRTAQETLPQFAPQPETVGARARGVAVLTRDA